MKKVATITLALALVLALSAVMVGCQTREYTPERQGTKVMTIDYRDVNGYVVDTFNSFGEFNGSMYAGMGLDGMSIPANRSLYTKSFFINHNLMVARFNDANNVSHFVSNIKQEGNTFTVSILRFEDTSIKKPSTKSYALFLEIPSMRKIKDGNIKLDLQPYRPIHDTITGNSLIATSNEPAIVDAITSIDVLYSYQKHVDKDTREKLNVYDAAFFTTHNLITVDFVAYDNTITTYDYNSTSHILNLNAYNSDHYMNSMRSHRMVKYIPMKKGTPIDKVMLNTYWEKDVNTPNIDTFEELPFKKEYLNK